MYLESHLSQEVPGLAMSTQLFNPLWALLSMLLSRSTHLNFLAQTSAIELPDEAKTLGNPKVQNSPVCFCS
jgi:hypothetical protein